MVKKFLQVESVRADLDAVQSTISLFSSQQQALVHESFLLLLQKCRDQLSVAAGDKAALSEALRTTERALAKIEGDCEVLRRENTKLQTQRSGVKSEITTLRDEIAQLQDQKRLQAVKITQSEAIAKEKDKKLSETEKSLKKLQERYATSEKNWKREHGKLEMEFEGKLAEARQESEQLSEERDRLSGEKSRLESRLEEIARDNERLARAKEEAESRIKGLEEEMVEVVLREDRNERAICASREEIASLLVEKAFLSAQLKLDQATFEENLAKMRESSESLSEVLAENSNLKETLGALEMEKSHLAKRLETIASKEQHIGFLESKISLLTNEQVQLQTEMESLNKKLNKAHQEVRMLEDSEHSRRLENEKVKMTLTTEISLLKSKLASVEEEKGKLERRLTEVGGVAAGGGGGGMAGGSGEASAPSAFHPVAGSKKQMAGIQSDSKQLRKQTLEPVGNRNAQVKGGFAVCY